MKFRNVDHVGIVVNDLDSVKEFFLCLGFTVIGEIALKGDWVDKTIGFKDVREDIVMLKAPEGKLKLELVKFQNPADKEDIRPAAINTFGLRHIALVVEDLEEIVKTLKRKGIKLVGKNKTFKDSWKLCYVRGPEGIIIELAERTKK
jgi:catechol 2,3-dioxygenase-like lactoylglutathione lyase family enzyme